MAYGCSCPSHSTSLIFPAPYAWRGAFSLSQFLFNSPLRRQNPLFPTIGSAALRRKLQRTFFISNSFLASLIILMTDHAISGETFLYFDRHCLDNTISAIGVSLLFYKDYFSLPRNIFCLGAKKYGPWRIKREPGPWPQFPLKSKNGMHTDTIG